MKKRVCIFTSYEGDYSEFENCEVVETDKFYEVYSDKVNIETINKAKFTKTLETEETIYFKQNSIW